MAQYREFTSTFFISDTEIQVKSVFLGGYQKVDVVTRDGSEDANFATVMNAHKAISLSASPTSTSPPCTVMTPGKWLKTTASGGQTTAATKIVVPSGNSGDLILNIDAGSFSMFYILNGGTLTAFSDGDPLTVVDGDELAFRVTSLAEFEFAHGSVTDSDTGTLLDSIQFFNSTPAP